MGRPKSNNPKSKSYRLRMTLDEYKNLHNWSKVLNKPIS